MRLLGTIVLTGLVLVGCDTGDGDGRTGAASPTTTVTVLSGVVERDDLARRPGGAVSYGTLRGVRGEVVD